MQTKAALWILGCTLGVTGCVEVPVERPVTHTIQDTPIPIPQNARNQVDILFMVDNSPSMEAMATELRAKFGQFFQVFRDQAAKGIYADLQIGVVTSDYGAGHVGTMYCDASPGGQRGLLQTLGAKAAAGCVGPTGNPFIKYSFTATGADSNLPAGKSLEEVFTCMASVGSDGCGFEHPLESVRAALKNSKENAGFVRDGALLAVVFVTNEDDASADPAVDFFSPDPNLVSKFGAYDTFRQTRFGVSCGDPLLPVPYAKAPVLGGCGATANNPQTPDREYDVSRYISFFNDPPSKGGIKLSREDVILFAIDAPEKDFGVIQAEHGSGNGIAPKPAYVECPTVDGVNCQVRLQHSCQNRVSPAFFGDPPVRLNAVIRKAYAYDITNICGDSLDQLPQYDQALTKLAQLINNHISEGCIPAPVKTIGDTTDILADADCNVVDVTNTATGDLVTEIVNCGRNPGVFPCWRVERKDFCAAPPLNSTVPRSPQGIGVTVDRNGVAAPPNTTAHASCSTVATPAPEM